MKADAGQIEQVILNLVVNARDAMPDGGTLTIAMANVDLDQDHVSAHPEVHAGEHVLITVSDTGCGMDAATAARIFEPFFTTKPPEKGTGLGLATVYGIVKQSGGHIEVDTEPNRGSTFKIYLPRDADAVPLSESAQAPRTSPGGTETVLLAEDEDGVRMLARLVLEKNGYKVLEARHGVEAVRICDQYKERIDLLVTDVVMPAMNGRQVADRLRELRPNMKVLYMSGYTDDAIVHHGVLAAGLPFLEKPFTPDDLAGKVRAVLDR